MANCLFCGSVLPSKVSIARGKVTRLRLTDSLVTSSGSNVTDPILQFKENYDDTCIHENLTTFFVLKQILKINNETLCQFLGLCDGDSFPECWVNVCQECGESVREFYQKFKLSPKSEEMEGIRKELIAKIRAGHQSEDGGPIWKKIRSEALKCDEDDNCISETPAQLEPEHASQLLCHLCGFEADTFEQLRKHFESHEKHSQEMSSREPDEERHVSVPHRKYDEALISSKKMSPIFIDLVDSDDDDKINTSAAVALPGDPTQLLCHSCGVIGTTLEQLQNHVERDHKSSEEISSRKVGGERHVPLPHPSYDYSNPNYVKVILGSGSLAVYDCCKCPVRKRTQEDMESHFKEHKKREEHEKRESLKQPVVHVACPYCGRRIPEKQMGLHLFQLHREMLDYTIIKSSGRARKYKCRHCPAAFMTYASITNHLDLHVKGSKALVCPEPSCGWFVNPSSLNHHKSLYHS